jgi:hypothetical protein
MIWSRWRWPILLFYLGAIMQAVVFGMVVLAGGSPVTPELYGPLVFAVPAVFWISSQIACSFTAAVGAAMNWPMTAGVGSLGMTVLLMFFGVMGMDAGAPGTLLVTGTIGWLGPLSAIATIISFSGVGGDR